MDNDHPLSHRFVWSEVTSLRNPSFVGVVVANKRVPGTRSRRSESLPSSSSAMIHLAMLRLLGISCYHERSAPPPFWRYDQNSCPRRLTYEQLPK